MHKWLSKYYRNQTTLKYWVGPKVHLGFSHRKPSYRKPEQSFGLSQQYDIKTYICIEIAMGICKEYVLKRKGEKGQSALEANKHSLHPLLA